MISSQSEETNIIILIAVIMAVDLRIVLLTWPFCHPSKEKNQSKDN